MTRPASFLKPLQSPIELEEALKGRNGQKILTGVDIRRLDTGAIYTPISEHQTDWETNRFHCIDLPGGAPDYAYTLNTSDMNLTSGLCVMVDHEIPLAGEQATLIARKYADGNRSFELSYTTDHRLQMKLYTTGDAERVIETDVAASYMSGERVKIIVNVQTAAGSTPCTCDFGLIDVQENVTIGQPLTTNPVLNTIATSTADLTVGGTSEGMRPFRGKIFRAAYFPYQAAGASVLPTVGTIADMDPRNRTAGLEQWIGLDGRVWRTRGNAYLLSRITP